MSCEYHLKYCQDSFVRNESWALELFQSWTQFTSKFESDSFINFGPFTECINFNHNLNSSKIHGQHCMVTYSSILLQEFENQLHHGFIFEEEMLMFRNGICLPSSCTLIEVENFTKHLLSETNFVALKTYCQTNQQHPPQTLDHFVIFTIVMLAIMTVLSTLYDISSKAKTTANVTQKFLIAFSIRKNLMNLLTLSSLEDSIDCINGIKVLAAFWIIIGHRMDMMIENPDTMSLFMSFGERMILAFARMFTSIVDTFFVVSGILVTRKCFRLFHEKKFNFLKLSLSRFMRFMPSLVVLFMIFMSSLPKKLVSGPQMIELEDEQEECRDSWLASLILMKNFSKGLCLRHTWYTSTDFQLFILSPSIIYGLFKLGRSFLKIIAFILLMGQINIFILKYFYLNDEFYYQTHYRFGPWFVGVIIGYVMSISRIYFWKARTKFIGWIVTISLVVFYEYFRDEEKGEIFDAFFEATHRIVWAVLIAWIIFVCHHLKCGGILKNFLEHRFWKPLAKMCLSIYLVHYINVLLAVVNMKSAYPFEFVWLLKTLCMDIILSLAFAFIFYMLVEAPFMNCFKAACDDR